MNNNTLFCRILLNETKKNFKEFCIKHKFDYKDIPDGFYWHGLSDNKNHAKAEGLRAYMDEIKGDNK
jgi:hypothetical protein